MTFNHKTVDVTGYKIGGRNVNGTPIRTKITHPYSYDPILHFKSNTQPTGSCYHDRMQQWDYAKFDRCMKAHITGGLYGLDNPKAVEALLRDYFDAPSLELTEIQEQCHQANGFPVFFFAFKR